MTRRLPTSAYVAWGTALAASVASIIFIEVLGKPSASLCWLNRMLIFGAFLVLSAGIVLQDFRVKWYVLPFVAIGLPAAILEQVVLWGWVPVGSGGCSVNVLCTTKFFDLLGFMSQGTLCLAAFVIVTIAVLRIHEPREDVAPGAGAEQVRPAGPEAGGRTPAPSGI